jgi:hypothetical protein
MRVGVLDTDAVLLDARFICFPFASGDVIVSGDTSPSSALIEGAFSGVYTMSGVISCPSIIFSRLYPGLCGTREVAPILWTGGSNRGLSSICFFLFGTSVGIIFRVALRFELEVLLFSD